MIKIFALKAKDNFSEKVRGICAQKNLYDAKNTRVFRDESVCYQMERIIKNQCLELMIV